MPPKKRKKTYDENQLGSTRSHLQQYFSTLPQTTSLLKNGHVLHAFLSSNTSRAETERVLQSAYPKERLPAVLKSRIKSLGAKNSKFRLRSVKEFEQFCEMCSETFNLGETTPIDVEEAVEDKDDRCSDVTVPAVPQAVADIEEPGQSQEMLQSPVPQPAASQYSSPFSDPSPSCLSTPDLVTIPQPVPSSSGVSTRLKLKPLTPQKAELRRKLDFAEKRIVTDAKAYRNRIKALTDKLKVPRRVMNQAIKRKDTQIQKKNEKIKELEAKLEGNVLALELKAVRQELADLKGKHEKLKAYHKKKKKRTPATIPLHEHRTVQRELTVQKEDLEVQLKEEREKSETTDSVVQCKKDEKTFCANYRRCMYNCLMNQVPVEATGQLIKDIVTEMTSLIPDSVADASTVSQCAYELGILADIQVGEALQKEENVNIAWDATSLDAEHVNEIHINCSGTDGESPRSLVLQIEILAGGKTADYVQHICQAIRDICNSYCEFNNADSLEFHQSVVTKLKSTLSDRVSVNHCVRVQLEEDLNIQLLELKCNVHPLDGLASESRKTLKMLDKESGFKGTVLGRDAVTVNVIYGIPKMRYKNGKGDPKGFKHFLKTNGIKSTMIARYVGNRMHVLFHLAGTLFLLHEKLLLYLKMSCNCQTGFRTALLKDLGSPYVQLQLKALGLVGKLLTGPWMAVLYSNKDRLSNLEAVPLLKTCLEKLRSFSDDPMSVLDAVEDCFGQKLNADEEVLSSLLSKVEESQLGQFRNTMAALLQGSVKVLERQLSEYISGDLSSPSLQMLELTKSAPVHNIESERILGLTDSQYRRAPNATIGFIDAKVKAKKTSTLNWLKSKTSNEQDRLIEYAIKRARKYRLIRKEREAKTTLLYQKHLKGKQQKKDRQARGKIERKIDGAIANVPKDFDLELVTLLPDVDKALPQRVVQDLADLPSLVGRYVYHVWDMGEEGDVLYYGKIVELKTSKKKPAKVRISYWLPEESEEDSEDSTFKVSAVLTDFLLGDLSYST